MSKIFEEFDNLVDAVLNDPTDQKALASLAECALMDTVGGFTAGVAHGELRYVVTRSADLHYVRPLTGSRMDVRCEVVKAGERTCLVRGEALDDQGRLCTEGLLEFFYVE